MGFLFDLGSLSYMMAFYSIYLLLVPKQFYGCKADRIISKCSYALMLFIMLFSFLAEIAFWEEYGKRFNFIAVDYLLYTYEVVQNIRQSFHLEIIIAILIVITFFSIKLAKKKDAFKDAFNNSDSFLMKIIPAFFWIFVLSSFHFNVENSDAEIFANQYENEISKSGIYSFFAAFDENELNYNDFYETNPSDNSYQIVRNLLASDNDLLNKNPNSIKRQVFNSGEEQKPNVIF
ncbi:MAG: LTA synthase family protein, partial [Lutibacter sp.]|nr:LTA synthase family protein [Lutibacter sp.]